MSGANLPPDDAALQATLAMVPVGEERDRLLALMDFGGDEYSGNVEFARFVALHIGREVLALRARVAELEQERTDAAVRLSRALGSPCLDVPTEGTLTSALMDYAAKRVAELEREPARWAARLSFLHTQCGADGSGCESGDPLDVIESEIRQVITRQADRVAELEAERDGYRNGQAQVQRDFDLLYADHQALSAAHRQLQAEVQQMIRDAVEAERKRCSQVIREHVHRHGLKGMAEKVLRDAAREIKWCGSR